MWVIWLLEMLELACFCRLMLSTIPFSNVDECWRGGTDTQ